jgi:predicted phage-related endonuclease
MRLGRLMEPVVIAEYAHRMGVLVDSPCPSLRCAAHPFLGATPDGNVHPLGDDDFPLDAKTTTFRRAHEFGEEGTDELPHDIVMQAQQQMLVCGSERQDTAVLLDGRTLRVYTVRRHERLIEGLIAAAVELRDRIIAGEAPDPDWRHTGTPALVRTLYGVAEGRTIDLGQEAAEQWREYQRLGKEASAIDKERKWLKARVEHAIGDAAIARLPDGAAILTRKSVERKGYSVEPTSYIDLREKAVK